MHCTSDNHTSLHINHNGNWSGDACIGWTDTDGLFRSMWVNGPALLGGYQREPEGCRATAAPGEHDAYGPLPIDVLGRAIALAVAAHACSRMTTAAESIWVIAPPPGVPRVKR